MIEDESDNVGISSTIVTPREESIQLVKRCRRKNLGSISHSNSNKNNDNNGNDNDNDNDNVDEISLNLPAKKSKIDNELLQVFLQWYFRFGHNISELFPNSKSCLNDLPKLIVMIDCIESWSPMMISCLIHTLHTMHENFQMYLKNQRQTVYNLPFILIMGVATTKRLLSLSIDGEASALISSKFFQFEPSNQVCVMCTTRFTIRC